MKVDLFYLSPNPYGGWVTYTSHLIDVLQESEVEVELFKIRSRSEKTTRDFGYGKRYRNISMAEALSRTNKKLIVAAAKTFQEESSTLYKEGGAGLVVHDPTELKNLPALDGRVIVIRKVGLETIPQATFIRHPYMMRGVYEINDKRTHAVSVSRIDFDKHTDILLDANRLLPDDFKIQIRGFENRIYTRFKIIPNYPEWVQSKAAYPRTKTAALELLFQSHYNVDMSQIKGDGGGSQYTFLEAFDAECVNIIHKSWIRPNDDMVPFVNCLAVENAEELADILNSIPSEEGLRDIRANGLTSLVNLHNYVVIGEQYREFFKSI